MQATGDSQAMRARSSPSPTSCPTPPHQRKRERERDIPGALTCDFRIVASPTIPKVFRCHRDGRSYCHDRRLPCLNNDCSKECNQFAVAGSVGCEPGNRRRSLQLEKRGVPEGWGEEREGRMVVAEEKRRGQPTQVSDEGRQVIIITDNGTGQERENPDVNVQRQR